MEGNNFHPGLSKYLPLASFKFVFHYAIETNPSRRKIILALKPPYSPLSSDTIGSLTKKAFVKYNIDPNEWGPHSTRGAGVTMYKALGLSAEQVCEIGKWKNLQAFSNNYFRINYVHEATQKLSAWVHRVSLWSSVEPEESRTHPTKERGGRDSGGDTLRQGEPIPHPIWMPIWK